jgi:hypothetical protein
MGLPVEKRDLFTIVSTCFARYFLKVGTRLAAMGSDDMP